MLKQGGYKKFHLIILYCYLEDATILHSVPVIGIFPSLVLWMGLSFH